MFEFIKKFFTKPVVYQEQVLLNEVDTWFSNKMRSRTKRLDDNFFSFFNSVQTEVSFLQSKIKELESAEIDEKENIQHRVKQVVLGNRQHYVRQLNSFIQNIKVPESKNAQVGMNYLNRLSVELDNFAKKTTKTYYTTQHLFHKQADEIAKIIKNLSNLLKEMKSTMKEDELELLQQTQSIIKEFFEKRELKSQLEKELIEKQSAFKKVESEINEFTNQIKNKTESDGFKDYTELEQKNKELDDSLKSMKDEIYSLFKSIERSLKKFEHIDDKNQKLIKEYINDPVKTLFEDKSFEILNILKELKANIDSLGLKDKEKEKTLDILKQITSKKLKDFVKEEENIKQQQKLLGQQVENHEVKKSINEIKYLMTFKLHKFDNIKEDIEKINEKLSSIDLEKLKQQIKESIKESINIDIILA